MCVDLYGTKYNFTNKQYLISINKHDYEINQKFDLSMRPHELNIMYKCEGSTIMVYSLHKKAKNYQIRNSSAILDYEIRKISAKKLFKYTITKIIVKIRERLHLK